MRVELRSEARDDLEEGAWFYEKQGGGLGDYFLDCIDTELAVLEVSFGIHGVVFGFHRKLVNRFPFAIYYRNADIFVDVVAILDCRRDPAYIENRLRAT